MKPHHIAARKARLILALAIGNKRDFTNEDIRQISRTERLASMGSYKSP